MKKSIPFCLIFLLAISSINAQPTLTFNNLYAQDIPITRHYLDAHLGSVGQSGENIIWDMSRLDYNPLELTIELKAAENTPYFNYFPEETHYNEANFCLVMYDGVLNTDYHYLLKTEESIEFMGNKSTDGVIELDFYGFQDRQKIFYSSLDYNELKVDKLEASVFDFSGSEWHYDKGVDSIHYDGYGTLITPDGETLEDIIRIKETVYHRDSTSIEVRHSIEEKYFWYQKDIAYPIIEIHVRTFNGFTNSNPIAFYNPPPIVDNLEEIPINTLSSLQLFPIPSNDVLNIAFESKKQNTRSNSQATISLYDVTGKLLEEKRVQLEGREHILQWDVSNLTAGFYSILVESSEGFYGGKFLKE